jgi:DNA/RNA-binding domain of Phe-tRNA-synthetase-like protein
MKVSRGIVADELAAEHPGLWLAWTEVEADFGPTRPTPPELRDRLRSMADRMRGADAIAMRRRDVPHAYRVFFRHVGLDPDVVRTPVEAIVLRRMREGGLRPQGLVPDALTVATLETGVGVWALDADAVSGTLTMREADGRLVLADDAGPLAVLFEEPRSRAAPSKSTRRLLLSAVAVPGVPDVSVHEALWTVADILAEGRTAAG